MTKALEMETVPSPCKALLYVRLSDVANMSIADALKLLQGLGYAPELRYVQWASDPKQVTLFGPACAFEQKVAVLKFWTGIGLYRLSVIF